jgi:hypothetical protein
MPEILLTVQADLPDVALAALTRDLSSTLTSTGVENREFAPSPHQRQPLGEFDGRHCLLYHAEPSARDSTSMRLLALLAGLWLHHRRLRHPDLKEAKALLEALNA